MNDCQRCLSLLGLQARISELLTRHFEDNNGLRVPIFPAHRLADAVDEQADQHAAGVLPIGEMHVAGRAILPNLPGDAHFNDLIA